MYLQKCFITLIKASVPLLLKKIGEDLEYLKKSLDIVRENPQFMANQFLSIGLQHLNSNAFEEVRFITNIKIDSS